MSAAMLDTGVYLSALSADSEAFADYAVGHLGRNVPACPEWNVTSLVGHLGGVYSWTSMCVNAGGAKPDGRRTRLPEGADPDETDAWFRERRHEVLHTLESHERDQPAWMFFPPHTADVGWWRRRQAHETAIHLHDMQTATGVNPSPLDPDFAADGVDEVLGQYLRPYLAATPVEGLEGTLHLHCTDAEGEWSLDFSGTEVEIERTHTKADAALRGPAQGLYLWLWNRAGLDDAGIEAFGNPAILHAWSRIRL